MSAERPDPDVLPAASGAEAGDEVEEGSDEAYSEDEEAAVAARLEDLGYI
ncbi:MAG TPA: hypothetical protein VGL44_04280 [Gaiellales bacterium]|jgi:hypothetical protein